MTVIKQYLWSWPLVFLVAPVALILCINFSSITEYFGQTVVSSTNEQVDTLFVRADQYYQQGEKLTAVKLKLIGSFLKTPVRACQDSVDRNSEELLSVEMYSVTTSAYPSEYRKAESVVGEELVNIGEPLLTLLMLKLEQLSLRSSLSEIEGGGACTAIRSLTLSSKERATILLYNILKKGDSNVLLWESCILAWRLKLPHIEELLNSIVSRSRGWGRQYSIFVLGEIGAHNSLPQIIEALSDTSPAVRRHSVLAISKVGDGSALAELRRLRDSDSDEIVRSLAAKTILEIENGLSSLEDVYPGL